MMVPCPPFIRFHPMTSSFTMRNAPIVPLSCVPRGIASAVQCECTGPRGGTTSAPDNLRPGSASLLAAPAGPARIAQHVRAVAVDTHLYLGAVLGTVRTAPARRGTGGRDRRVEEGAAQRIVFTAHDRCKLPHLAPQGHQSRTLVGKRRCASVSATGGWWPGASRSTKSWWQSLARWRPSSGPSPGR